MNRTTPALIAVLLASTAGSALAEFRYDLDGGGSVLLYGQFDPAYLIFDDGVDSYGNLVDNVNSNSRFGLDFTQQYGENTFRFNFESAFGFRGSAGVSQVFKVDEFDWDRTNIRKVDFSLKTPMYGTFYVGQGSMATDGVAESDLSGTTLVTYSSISDTASQTFPSQGWKTSRNVAMSCSFAAFSASFSLILRCPPCVLSEAREPSSHHLFTVEGWTLRSSATREEVMSDGLPSIFISTKGRGVTQCILAEYKKRS